MSKFKVGDKVVITNSEEGNPSILKNGVTGIVLDNHSYPFVQFDVLEDDSLNDAIGLGVSGRCYSVSESEIDLLNPYIQSNRYKLQQAIKKTGFHADKLSLASNHAKTYFTGFTAESRFNSRGDITEDRLNSLLTTLAFAERKLLDLAPKTVDENNVPVGNGEAFKVISELNNSVFESSKQIHDAYVDYYAEAANDKNQKDNKAKKFLIVFALLVIILAVYFFTR